MNTDKHEIRTGKLLLEKQEISIADLDVVTGGKFRIGRFFKGVVKSATKVSKAVGKSAEIVSDVADSVSAVTNSTGNND